MKNDKQEVLTEYDTSRLEFLTDSLNEANRDLGQYLNFNMKPEFMAHIILDAIRKDFPAIKDVNMLLMKGEVSLVYMNTGNLDDKTILYDVFEDEFVFISVNTYKKKIHKELK